MSRFAKSASGPGRALSCGELHQDSAILNSLQGVYNALLKQVDMVGRY